MFLCGTAGLLWVYVEFAPTDTYGLVDSSGKDFTLIELPTLASMDLDVMPDNSVAVVDGHTPVAIKIHAAPRSTVAKALLLPSVKAVLMRNCKFSGYELSGGASLEQLAVANCSISDAAFHSISGSESLAVLDIADEPSLTAGAVSTVVNEHRLRHLGLFNVPSNSAALSIDVSALRELQSLLVVGHTNDDAMFRQLAMGGMLRTLVIDNTGVSASAVEDSVRSNPSLTQLVVSDCRMSAEALQSVFTLTDLKLLTVSHVSSDAGARSELRRALLRRFPGAQITLGSTIEE